MNVPNKIFSFFGVGSGSGILVIKKKKNVVIKKKLWSQERKIVIHRYVSATCNDTPTRWNFTAAQEGMSSLYVLVV